MANERANRDAGRLSHPVIGSAHIVEWEDSDGHIHEGVPTDTQLDGSKAVKVKFVNDDDESDVRYAIVRHPSNFKTLNRVIFDIQLAAKRYGFQLNHE